MDPVRIGVIGTGRMGASHCRVYSNLRHAKFVGICDANVELGKDVARRHEVSFFRDVDSLLENVDAVSVCTPTPDHFEIVKRCLDQNIHIMVEKPFTETLEQAKALKDAALKSKVVVQVGHIEKYNPAYMELRKVLEGMDILAMNFNRLSPFQGSNVDVDVILDLMIHDIGLVVDLFDTEPISMDAHGFSVFTDTIDHGLAVIKFAPEILLSLTASRITEQKIRGISVTTKDAYIEADLLQKTIAIHRRTLGDYINQQNSHKYRQESLMERIVVPAVEPLFLELQDFVNCVSENKTPQVTAEDGYNALRFVLLLRDKILESRRNKN
ncbi:MAG TPA: Gfo/Idh/MocA family oxidoreductase [Anaerolineales bacterium]|nr:Gfo/Idh/MocA family oxidoreductase [Anaerolineales bacterium]